MKTKLLSIFALAIMMASCSNEELIDSDFQQPAPKQTSSIRSYEEALQIAQASIQMVDGQAQTRAASSRIISLNDSKVCLTGSKTRSENGNDTLMYVFNFEDNQGFAVVSANKATEGLIAITGSGNYNPDEPSEIDGFNLYMDLVKKYIASRGPGLDPILPDGRDSFAVEFNYVGPYITVNWGQVHPEGEFCSNGICGCSNTAIAQIMSYYEHPSGTPITYPNRDVYYQTFNWTQMKAHQTGHARYDNSCSSDDIHTSIGRLCRQSGYIAGSYYAQDYTSTTLPGKKSALQFFGYNTNDWTYYSNASIKDTIDAGCPMIICGWDPTVSDIGHAWVMDGYMEKVSLHYWISHPIVGSNIEIAELIDTNYTYYYHFNWGWYGWNNGYFLYNVFDTDNGLYDSSNHVNINFNFNSNVQILCPHPIN